jgi:hypothetical protein
MRIRRFAIGAIAAGILSPIYSIAAAPPALTNGTLFRGDASGANQQASNVVNRGVWTSVLDQQNIPGNYMAELFFATTPTPAPGDFFTPASALSQHLNPGDNTIYFWGDGDDLAGGTAGFGMNLYLDGASSVAPSISVFAPVGVGQPFVANGATPTAGYDGQAVTGANRLSIGDAGQLVTLTAYEVTGIGGATAGAGSVDLVNSTNTAPFTPPPHPDGITDTYGHFTLTVTPEPASIGLLASAAVCLIRRKRKTDIPA